MGLVKRVEEVSAGLSWEGEHLHYEGVDGIWFSVLGGLEGADVPEITCNDGLSVFWRGVHVSDLAWWDGLEILEINGVGAAGNPWKFGVSGDTYTASGGSLSASMYVNNYSDSVWLHKPADSTLNTSGVHSYLWVFNSEGGVWYIDGEEVVRSSWSGSASVDFSLLKFGDKWWESFANMFSGSATYVSTNSLGFGVWTRALVGDEVKTPLSVLDDCVLSFDLLKTSLTPEVYTSVGKKCYSCLPISGYLGPEGDYPPAGCIMSADATVAVTVVEKDGSYDVWSYEPSDSSPVSGLEFRCFGGG